MGSKCLSQLQRFLLEFYAVTMRAFVYAGAQVLHNRGVCFITSGVLWSCACSQGVLVCCLIHFSDHIKKKESVKYQLPV